MFVGKKPALIISGEYYDEVRDGKLRLDVLDILS